MKPPSPPPKPAQAAKETSRSLPIENEAAPPTSKKGGFFGKKKDADENGSDNAALVSRIAALEQKNKILTDRVQLLESKVDG